MASQFGHLFRITTYGESHGHGLGVVIDGCPSKIPISLNKIQAELLRRRPGTPLSSPRQEPDTVQCLSGLQNGVSLGTPISLFTTNQDARSHDYKSTAKHYRNSHADYTNHQKYGIYPAAGGGRSSARETVARVMAGSVAKQMLETQLTQFKIRTFVNRVAHLTMDLDFLNHHTAAHSPCFSRAEIEHSLVRCPHPQLAQQMENHINYVKQQGDTVGGEICCVIYGIPPGLGEPVFDKLNADLAGAMMSLPAARTFTQGVSTDSMTQLGSQNNDALGLCPHSKTVIHTTNRAGGIEGGISNGAPVVFKVGFKAPSSIFKPQSSVTHNGKPINYHNQGRHDPCVLPRAVPIVEAMACLVIADHQLRQLVFHSQHHLAPSKPNS